MLVISKGLPTFLIGTLYIFTLFILVEYGYSSIILYLILSFSCSCVLVKLNIVENIDNINLIWKWYENDDKIINKWYLKYLWL